MTRIRASCPSCGEVDLRPDAVVLHVVRAPDGVVSDGWFASLLRSTPA